MNSYRMKTQDLTGAALDWAVAKAAEYLNYEGDRWMVSLPGVPARMNFVPGTRCVFMPSTRWAQGGPIIEREGISVVRAEGGFYWQATHPDMYSDQQGDSPLIAAMRCYVMARLGNEIDIPEELK